MTANLMDFERDNKLLADKLVRQKQQIIDDDASYCLRRKFGAVKISVQKPVSCTVSAIFRYPSIARVR
jgi:hypothetical protein